MKASRSRTTGLSMSTNMRTSRKNVLRRPEKQRDANVDEKILAVNQLVNTQLGKLELRR
jgi:hypothetical protein